MMRSLRLRLLIQTTTATSVVLALLGLAVYFSMRRSLLIEFDKALMAHAQALATIIETDGRQIRMEFDAQQMPEFAAKNRPAYFQALLDNKTVVARSPSLGDQNLPDVAQTSVPYQNLPLPDGRRGRALTFKVKPRLENDDEHTKAAAVALPSVSLTIAVETTSLDQTLENLRWLLFGLCSLAILLTGAVLMGVVRHAVRPVERVAGEIERLRETDLSNRLALGDVPVELAPVVEKLNGLLARLEAAFQREKSFTADVAHELRTPLAGLQTTLEVCRSRPRDQAAYISMIDKCHGMTQRMQVMVENLLLLARTESGQLAVQSQPVEVGLLLDECWAMFSGGADARQVQVDWNAVAPLVAQTDQATLRIVFDNVLDNAVSYVDERGTIRVSASRNANAIVIEVANTGSQLGSEDFAHLFERFWRGDNSRTDTGMHCGLGLSLCRRLLQMLDGTISVQTAPKGWFNVRVELPVGRAAAPSIKAEIAAMKETRLVTSQRDER
ncbi:MAG: ATP-binding protein [Planctomycetota bacterium]|nr:ATP-binding protein [Planctomycetota bacterium]